MLGRAVGGCSDGQQGGRELLVCPSARLTVDHEDPGRGCRIEKEDGEREVNEREECLYKKNKVTTYGRRYEMKMAEDRQESPDEFHNEWEETDNQRPRKFRKGRKTVE